MMAAGHKRPSMHNALILSNLREYRNKYSAAENVSVSATTFTQCAGKATKFGEIMHGNHHKQTTDGRATTYSKRERDFTFTKNRRAMPKGELRRDAQLPYIGPCTHRWINHKVWPVCRQTYGYLPSLRASAPFDQYQATLHGDRGTQV